MTQLAICTDLDRCVGCLACSVSCKVVNGVPIGNFWNKTLRVGPTPKKGGSGQYPDVETYFLNVQCQHCENPQCVSVCPTEASHKLPDGTILLSTNGHGMMRQSHGKSLGLPKALRAIDSYALNMAWGPDSSLWMVTDDKLMRYSFGEDRLDVFGAADFGENLTFSESQCCIFQDSLLYVGAIPGMMEVDVKAIDRYVEARDDGGGTKPWHGAIAVAAAVATALGAALACKRRKKAKAAPQRYGVAPAKPEVVGADTAFVARLNSVLNSVIPTPTNLL